MDKNLVEAYEVACEKKDIDNFVSFTAVTVSASRLADGMREIPLYRDPLLADMLGSSKGIRAAAEEFRQLVIKQEEEKGQSHVVSMVVLRTHYLEDQLSAALAAMPTDASLVQGTIRQVVILGSGLATTAWRRDFPSGTALFEVDQTDMSAFKKQCLAHSGAQMDASKDPSGFKFPLKADSWGAVATDLMQPDWETDLEAKGFKRGLPTAYLAEGLLYYLTPEAVKNLLSTLASISGPGSALLFSCINEPFFKGSKRNLEASDAETDGHMTETTRRFNESFQFGIPADVASFLAPLGWNASADKAVRDIKTLYQEYGIQEFDSSAFDVNKEKNEELFGPIKYLVVHAKLAT